MMDRFKVRVWDKVFNRYWTDEEIKENAAWLLFPDNDNIRNVEIKQCTGLRDVNGKLIFEGDIMGMSEGNALVVWNNQWFLNFGDFSEPFWHYTIVRHTIVGNIHENPELLK